MIVCPKCGKENQDHYKFCLGCGNELPRDTGGGNRPFRPTPPAVNIPATAGRVAPPQPAAVQPIAPPPVAQQPFAPPAQPPMAQPPMAQPFAPPAQPPMAQPFAPPAQPPMAQPPAAQPFAPPPVAQQPFAPPAQPPMAQPFAPPAGYAPPPQPFAQPAPMPQPPAQPLAPTPAPSAALPANCPNCGSPNPRGNRFCITCGFDMSSAAAQQPAAPVAQAPAAANVAPTPPARPAVVERARLVLIRPDGSEGGTFPLHEGETRVGRESGPIFQQDTYLSPRHATFLVAPGAVTVRDDASLNGVYVRIERQVPVEINDTDVFRIGQEILRYDAFAPVTRQPDGTERIGSESEGLVGRISLVTGRDTYGNAFPVPITGLYLGRERGDILFPEDGYVSGLHCQLAVNNGRLSLTDVGSSNGSYLRIRGQRALRNGDYLLMGQQLFRLQIL